MFKTTLISLLLASGCTAATAPHADLDGGWWYGAPLVQHYEQVKINISEDMEPYAGILMQGADAWRSFGIEFVVDSSEKRTIRCADESTLPDGAVGWTDGTGIRFRCSELAETLSNPDQDISFQQMKVIAAAHELGHYLGLLHVQDEGAVMNASHGPKTAESFHQSDVDEFYLVNH